MDYLILSPPVTTPSEPPCGAFLLAAGLTARGFDVGLLDLSLELFHPIFDSGSPATRAALAYLRGAALGYDPARHRSAAGQLHHQLKAFSRQHPGWRLTPMDIAPPGRVHDPKAVAAALDGAPSPFADLWEHALDPVLARHAPREILVSVAYLSQLPAAIDLARALGRRGITPRIGGSLLKSLATTGHGLESLTPLFPRIATDDGMSVMPRPDGSRMLDRLAWPRLLSNIPYLSARPVIPLALSSGCFWNRCRFCPDHAQPFTEVPEGAVAAFMSGIPAEIRERRPVIHLVDSALPPGLLRAFLPLCREHGADFFGFARPTRALLAGDLIAEAARSGCLMLQLGGESGSKALLDRFDKGIDPAHTASVLREAARHGVRTYLYLLFGLPWETREDLDATLDMVADNIEHIDFLNLSLFNLPRFCELSERAADIGIDIEDFPGRDQGIRLYWPFTADGVDTREQARVFLKTAFKTRPKIRAAHLRTPRWFRAAHLATMTLPGRR